MLRSFHFQISSNLKIGKEALDVNHWNFPWHMRYQMISPCRHYKFNSKSVNRNFGFEAMKHMYQGLGNVWNLHQLICQYFLWVTINSNFRLSYLQISSNLIIGKEALDVYHWNFSWHMRWQIISPWSHYKFNCKPLNRNFGFEAYLPRSGTRLKPNLAHTSILFVSNYKLKFSIVVCDLNWYRLNITS